MELPMPKGKQGTVSANSQEVVSFLRAAINDYIAARVLLNSQLPLQGVVLASTAIESISKLSWLFMGTTVTVI